MNSKLIIYFIALVLFVSCSSKPLVGKWKLDNINIEKAIADFPNNQKIDMRRMLQTSLNNLKGKFFIEFSDDGKFTIEAPDEIGKLQKKSGTWVLSPDKKKLTTDTDGKEETVGIIEISSKKIVLNMSSPTQSAFEMSFIPR